MHTKWRQPPPPTLSAQRSCHRPTLSASHHRSPPVNTRCCSQDGLQETSLALHAGLHRPINNQEPGWRTHRAGSRVQASQPTGELTTSLLRPRAIYVTRAHHQHPHRAKPAGAPQQTPDSASSGWPGAHSGRMHRLYHVVHRRIWHVNGAHGLGARGVGLDTLAWHRLACDGTTDQVRSVIDAATD